MAARKTPRKAVPWSADAGAARPLYQQIKDRIIERIAAGDWRPGRKIPSENELVHQLGVSRMTINRALRELAQEGHLQRVAGVGTFVSEPPQQASLIALRDIAEELRAVGSEHHARLLRLEKLALDTEIAARMELAPGQEAAHVVLVHRRDDLPIQLEERWVNLELVPDFLAADFTVTTPSEHLLRTLEADEMEHRVQAVMPDPATCRQLAIASSEPCLRLERRTWNAGRVVTFAVLTYPSSRYALGARYPLRGEASPAAMLRPRAFFPHQTAKKRSRA